MQVIERGRMRVERCSDRPVFKNPVSKINDERQYLDSLSHMFETACKAALRTKRQELAEAAAKLNGLSPLGTLGRGYSLTKDDSGRVVRSVSQVNSGDMINVTVADGDFSARVV